MQISLGAMRLTRRAASSWRLLSIAALAFMAAPVMTGAGANAKTPGKTYCYLGVCHRVLTLAETRRRVGRKSSVIASYYSHCRVDRFNPCGLTSSGAVFRPSHADNAASPIYPNGTKLLVWNPANKRAAVVRIDNAGPYWRNRTLDLSRAAADKLGFRKRGVARLIVQVLEAPTRREATYRRRRRYAPVRGYIGRFKSLANAVASTRYARRAVARRAIAQVANVVLPVQNTFVTEQRIWNARMVESGPISVAMMARPKIRLPAQLVRAAVEPVRRARKPRRKIASLGSKATRSAVSKRRTTKGQSVSRPVKGTPKKRSIPSVKAASAGKAAAKQQKKTVTKVAKAPAPVVTKQVKPAVAQSAVAAPVAVPRPNRRWRQRLMGESRGGA